MIIAGSMRSSRPPWRLNNHFLILSLGINYTYFTSSLSFGSNCFSRVRTLNKANFASIIVAVFIQRVQLRLTMKLSKMKCHLCLRKLSSVGFKFRLPTMQRYKTWNLLLEDRNHSIDIFFQIHISVSVRTPEVLYVFLSHFPNKIIVSAVKSSWIYVKNDVNSSIARSKLTKAEGWVTTVACHPNAVTGDSHCVKYYVFQRRCHVWTYCSIMQNTKITRIRIV